MHPPNLSLSRAAGHIESIGKYLVRTRLTRYLKYLDTIWSTLLTDKDGSIYNLKHTLDYSGYYGYGEMN